VLIAAVAMGLLSGCMRGGMGYGGKPVEKTTVNGVTVTSGLKFTEAEMGLPYYPGAKASAEPGMKAEDERLGTGMNMKMQVLMTNDALEQVVGFYTQKLGQPISTMNDPKIGNMVMFSGGESQTAMKMVTVGQEPGKKEVSISLTSMDLGQVPGM
jgi:hypothetical protein